MDDWENLNEEERITELLKNLTIFNRDARRTIQSYPLDDLATMSQAKVDEVTERVDRLQASRVSLEQYTPQYELKENFREPLDHLDDYCISLERIKVHLDARLCALKQPTPACASVSTEAQNVVYLRPTPDITPPTFDGSKERWTSWWSFFQEEVHKSPHLSEYQKYRHLLKSLKGEALRVIGEPMWIEGAYERALEDLKGYYINPTRDRKVFLQRIQFIKPPQNEAEDLIRFLREWKAATTAYTNVVGQAPHEELLDYIFRPKIPGRLLQAVYDLKDDSNLPLKELIEALSKKARNWESAQLHLTTTEGFTSPMGPPRPVIKANGSRCPPKQQPQQPKGMNSLGQAPLSQPSLFMPSPSLRETAFKTRTEPCLFCSGNHHPTFCPTYPNVLVRLDRLRAMQKCTACFSKKHHSTQCGFSAGCRKCRGKHKLPVCPNLSSIAARMVETQSPPSSYVHPFSYPPSTHAQPGPGPFPYHLGLMGYYIHPYSRPYLQSFNSVPPPPISSRLHSQYKPPVQRNFSQLPFQDVPATAPSLGVESPSSRVHRRTPVTISASHPTSSSQARPSSTRIAMEASKSTSAPSLGICPSRVTQLSPPALKVFPSALHSGVKPLPFRDGLSSPVSPSEYPSESPMGASLHQRPTRRQHLPTSKAFVPVSSTTNSTQSLGISQNPKRNSDSSQKSDCWLEPKSKSASPVKSSPSYSMVEPNLPYKLPVTMTHNPAHTLSLLLRPLTTLKQKLPPAQSRRPATFSSPIPQARHHRKNYQLSPSGRITTGGGSHPHVPIRALG